MVRLFIIEDHLTVIVSSLRFLFRPQRDDIKVVGYSADPEDIVKNADPSGFDLFVLDLHIPGLQPIDNIRKLKKHFPDKPVVIFTNDKSSSWKAKMLQEGASAYITKDANRDDIKMALKKASAGEIFISSFSVKDNLNDIEVTREQLSDVTPLQKEILSLLSQGLTHKEISVRTGISRSLVEKILKQLREYFHVKNNIELINQITKTGSF